MDNKVNGIQSNNVFAINIENNRINDNNTGII